MARRANVEWETPKNDQSEYIMIELMMDLRGELQALNSYLREMFPRTEKGNAPELRSGR